MKKPVYLFLVLFSVAQLLSCQQKTQLENNPTSEDQTPLVVVVNYPLEFIVESIAGPAVKVLNPVPADADPETWFPDDAMIQTIQQADLIVTNGADFSDWVKKLSLPRSKVLRTSLSLKEALITVPDFEVHSHGSGDAHSHAGTVSFFWLDPRLMTRQANAIAQRLALLLPRQQEEITANLKKLEDSLEPLNQKLDQLRTSYPGLQWFSQRPVYQYLTRRTDWKVFHLHWKKKTEPDDPVWENLIAMQEQHKVPLMLWEYQPEDKQVKALQQRGVASFVLNPLTVKPSQGNYLTEMQRQLDQLEEFLKQHTNLSKSKEN
tara:strand:- start:4173 stop:5129 length:957 start_codon:yes stop_codon:yes gene_type:complete